MNCAELAEQLLEQHQKANPKKLGAEQKSEERRKSQRKNYDCWQLVAEYTGPLLPIQENFQLRHFLDISAGGFSFLAEERPKCDELIVALGPIPFVYFQVQVARAVRRKDLDEQPLQIGCRFIKRIT